MARNQSSSLAPQEDLLERKRRRLYNLIRLTMQRKAPMLGDTLNHQIWGLLLRLTLDDFSELESLMRIYLESCE